MASQEMLRKLLDDFSEKEALVQEELKVIEEQIEELERRLDLCRGRLGTIGTDRDRVLQIRSRYADGTFYSPSQIGEYHAPEPQAQPRVEPTTQPKPEPKIQPKAEPKVEPKVETKPEPKPAETPVEAKKPSRADLRAAMRAEAPPQAQPAPWEVAEAAPAQPAEPQPSSTQSGIQAILGGRRNTGSQPIPQMEPQPETVAEVQQQPGPQPEPVWEAPQEAWTPPEQPQPVWQEPQPQVQSDAGSALSALSADWGAPQEPDNSGYEAQWELPDQQEQQAQPFQQPQPQPQPVQQQPQASDDNNAGQGGVDLGGEEKSDEENSETVKSINDALRSLFR